MEKEVPITYETLFELVMREKGREELQKIEPGLYSDLLDYIGRKKQVAQDTEAALSSEDDGHIFQQLRNIRRLVRELYERREKKIINMALIRSRTGSDAMDLSALLEEERKFFMSLVEQLDTSRKKAIGRILSEQKTTEQKSDVPPKQSGMTVRFLTAVPKFMGKELEVYGPFSEGDIKELPNDLADVLIARGKAVHVA